MLIAANSDILGDCSGTGFQLIQGPYDWNGTKWAVCQDCNSAASNPIMTCQSTGGGGGVDVGNISQLSCVSLGGTGTFIPKGGIVVMDVRKIGYNHSKWLNKGQEQHVFNDSLGGGKWVYANRSDAAAGNCPGAGTFGI